MKKHEEMFRNHEKSIIQLILGNTALTNQRLDNLSKDIVELKESLEFTQEETKQIFNKINQTQWKKICSASRMESKSFKIPH